MFDFISFLNIICIEATSEKQEDSNAIESS